MRQQPLSLIKHDGALCFSLRIIMAAYVCPNIQNKMSIFNSTWIRQKIKITVELGLYSILSVCVVLQECPVTHSSCLPARPSACLPACLCRCHPIR